MRQNMKSRKIYLYENHLCHQRSNKIITSDIHIYIYIYIYIYISLMVSVSHGIDSTILPAFLCVALTVKNRRMVYLGNDC